VAAAPDEEAMPPARGGDTPPWALHRLERDVLSLKPTVVSIRVGLSDGGCRPFDQAACDRLLEVLESQG